MQFSHCIGFFFVKSSEFYNALLRIICALAFVPKNGVELPRDLTLLSPPPFRDPSPSFPPPPPSSIHYLIFCPRLVSPLIMGGPYQCATVIPFCSVSACFCIFHFGFNRNVVKETEKTETEMTYGCTLVRTNLTTFPPKSAVVHV